MLQDKLGEAELEILKKRGYSPLQYRGDNIGEGDNRSCFLVEFSTETGHKELRVLKMRKSEVEPRTVSDKIYKSKGYGKNTEELAWVEDLKHPRIAKILDSFYLDGQVAIVEEYTQARSLEDLISEGAFRGEDGFSKIKSIYGQVLEALVHAHAKGIVHRDVKPSNILVDKEGNAAVTDWQNAKRVRDIREQLLPTRGGTSYTDPNLLNSLINNTESLSSDNTDIYALGVTLYKMITGKLPFNYKLTSSDFKDKGKEITIGSEKVRVILKDDETEVEHIDASTHEKNLKKALADVPKGFRQMLYRSMTMTDKKKYYSVHSMQTDLSEVKEPKQKILSDAWKGLKKGFYVAAAAAGVSLALLIWPSMNEEPVNRYNTQQAGIMRNIRGMNMDFVTMNMESREQNWETIESILKDAKKKIDVIYNKKESDTLDFYVTQTARIHNQDPKITSNIYRACKIVGEEKINKAYGGQRTGLTAIPKLFVFRNRFDDFTNPDVMTDGPAHAYAAMYLKQAIGLNTSVEDIFASYFCSSEDIFTARAKTGNMSYFTRVENNVVKPGYREFLDSTQRQLTDYAIALYMITDLEGKVHFDTKINSSQPKQAGPSKDLSSDKGYVSQK